MGHGFDTKLVHIYAVSMQLWFKNVCRYVSALKFEYHAILAHYIE